MRPDKTFRGCLFDAVILLIMTVSICMLGAKCAHGGLSECIDATCRVSCGDGRGTGCCIQVSGGYVWVLTNAHVADRSTAWCEFYRYGHPSRKMEGKVVARDTRIDAAIIAVHESHFEGYLPPAMPIAGAEYSARPGATLVSVGCANGHWPSLWRGYAIGQSEMNLTFRPGPEGGRSGSAIFDADGTRIVGLLRARDGSKVTDNSVGIATNVAALRTRIVEPCTVEYRRERQAQCGPGGCPPRGGYGGGGGGIFGGGGGYGGGGGQQPAPQSGGNWPSLPPADKIEGGGKIEVSPKVDLSDVTGRLDALNGNVESLLIEIRDRNANEPPPIPAPDSGQVEANTQAIEGLRATDEQLAAAVEQAADVAGQAVQATGEINAKVDQVAAQQQAVADNIKQHGGLQERVEARMAAVEARVGEDAGKIEKSKEYLRDWFEDRIRNDGLIGWIRGAVILLVVIFLVKDVKDKVVKNDPLFVEDPRGELQHLVADLRGLRDRVRGVFDRDDPDPEPAPAKKTTAKK